MDIIIRRNFWMLDLVVVGLCALLMARATASVLHRGTGAATVPSRPARQPFDPRFATASAEKRDAILERNIFCSTCPPPIDVPNPDTRGEIGSHEPVKTSLPLALLSIMYAKPPLGWRWSLAVIRDSASKAQGPFSTGMKLRDATIVAIEPKRVYFDHAGTFEYLDLIETPAPLTPKATTLASAPATSAQDHLPTEIDRGIKKTGEHTYELSRSTVDQVVGNLGLLSRWVRVTPEMRDGRVAGFRLHGVRSDGPFAKLGLQNGDVIASINGLEVSSPEKAFEAYSKLRSASHLSLGIERNNRKITKDYGIR